MSLTRSDLAARMATAAGITQAQAADALRAFESTVTETLVAGDSVKLTGFASFETSERSARTGRNPQTGEAIDIPAATVAKITPGAALKSAVKGS
ncbi:HU family DNA-binding protein [Demequina flava]|uniref:HU family DNA-binding protein n=1 Tax=Demequina flava TaxID=1095025 RepID=UPI000783DACB|nr:HU family DNA-binding protein [Demequina flava]